MNTIIWVILTLLSVPVSLALFGFAIYLLAEQNLGWFTIVPTGHIKAVARAGTIERIIINVPGKKYNPNTDEIIDGNPDEPSWPFNVLEKRLGLYFVSFLWPIVKVKEWHFQWGKLVSVLKTDSGRQIQKFEVEEKDELISSLLWRYPYPVQVTDAEVKDNFLISFLLKVGMEVRKPRYLIGILNGRWFAPAVTEISGDAANLEDLRDSDIEKFQTINKRDLFGELLKPELASVLSGAIMIHEVSFVDYNYGSNSQKILDAITAEGVADRIGQAAIKTAQKDIEVGVANAKAKVARAEGDAQALTKVGEAEAGIIEKKLVATKAHPEGGAIERTRLLADGIKGHKGALALGSSGTLLAMNDSAEKEVS